LQVVTLSNGKRPQEYLNTIEELKKSFIRSIDIVNKLRDLGLKYGLTKEEIRRDIELALEGIVKPRQLRSLLPLELKDINKIRVQPKKPQKKVAAVAAAKPLPPQPQPIIEFRAKISKMGDKRMICVPTYLHKHVQNLGVREIKVMIL
jgi:hypothetical protein